MLENCPKNRAHSTKHDKEKAFDAATLENCIYAIAGYVALLCVRYGPYFLFENRNIVSGIMNHLFEFELVDSDPKTFYIPKVIFPKNKRRTDLFCGEAKNFVQKWVTKDFKIKP